MFQTNDLQDNTFSDDDINVTNNTLYLFVPRLIPSVESQLMFNEATQNIYKIASDERYTERPVKSDKIVQHDIGSAQHINSPKYLVFAQETKGRTNAPNKKNNIAFFDNLDLQKYHAEIDSIQYPRDSLLINYEENDCIQQ